jgi:hypothetical protein
VFKDAVCLRIKGTGQTFGRTTEAGECNTMKEFRDLYPSRNNKLRRMKRMEYTAPMGQIRNAYKILFGKPEG